jgi:hypothetical protein
LVGECAGDKENVAVVLKAENRLIGHMPFHPWYSPHIYEIGWILNKIALV